METKRMLVVRAKNGDEEALQTLLQQEKEKLYKMAYVYVQNKDDALEVFQETVYQVIKSIATLKNDNYFSTWVTRILINTAIVFLRKKQGIVPLSQDILENMGEPWRVKKDEQLDLLEAMGEIEEKYKTVLLLRFYEDYSIVQISKFLNCPEGTVKTNIRRGLAALKKKMKGVYADVRQNSHV
ncbi:sigma-70 family RNA polymerase sigma factor [Sporosarcina saromensis]|uniref:Sigma-70 family RNA polymerase sigma factor n=1 Tax=Sporosarcina saromensis TaxID=359365 RepID=A0ABU4G4T2_9BACL|nr:sigma-70 family RNA polymerase sigma factor [Sporosarcina saromensis]MDW0111974.1 sigma-70 family RNA polymerase sigma factor [Sporosarcina saromensis]